MADLPLLPLPYRVRLAMAADVPALAALYAHCARTLGPQVYTPEQVAAWERFGHADAPAFRAYILTARTWLANDARDVPRLAGFCGVGPGDAAGEGEVHSLYVRPDAMRQGLASRMLAHALVDARAQGMTHFSAWATPFSRAVFERAGFALAAVVREPFQGVMFERYRYRLTERSAG